MQNEDHARIWAEWHRASSSRDQAALLALYAEDAVLEAPLIPAILKGHPSGVVRGRTQIKHFLDEAARQSPATAMPGVVMLWWRTGTWFSAGDTLVWEYPRETPDGEQIDILEVMDIRGGLIRHHRVYWGWKACSLVAPALTVAARKDERARTQSAVVSG